jgi:hypothetical protein
MPMVGAYFTPQLLNEITIHQTKQHVDPHICNVTCPSSQLPPLRSPPPSLPLGFVMLLYAIISHMPSPSRECLYECMVQIKLNTPFDPYYLSQI